MNNDPVSDPAPRLRAQFPGADDEQDGASQSSDRAEETGESSSVASRESMRQQKRRAGLAKKLQSVNHLQKSLDTIVFAYVCILYYME